MDEKFSDQLLHKLNVFVLNDELGKKYDVSTPNEFAFLNNLIVSERNLDYTILADYIKREYLHIKKLTESFNPKMKFLRKLVSYELHSALKSSNEIKKILLI